MCLCVLILAVAAAVFFYMVLDAVLEGVARRQMQTAAMARIERKITDCRTLTELSEYRNHYIDDKVQDTEYLKNFAKQDLIPITNTRLGNMAYICLHASEPYNKQMRVLLQTIIEEKKLTIKLEDI